MMPMPTPRPVSGVIPKKGDFGSFMLKEIAALEEKWGVRLGLIQKILLGETGTVEQVLSIMTGSTVRVKVVKQEENENTIIRQSMIMNYADKVLISAHSTVFTQNLPATIVKKIRKQDHGIGTIMARSSLETFRKIVQVGYCPKNRSVFRRYQIIYRRKVAIEIREELVGIESGPGGI
jgi:chorismate-pyruvate lyase